MIMKPVFRAPKGATDKKPPHGSPCNRCGLCCMASLCDLGQHLFHRDAYPGPCPALRSDGEGTYSCDVVANPQDYMRHTAYLASEPCHVNHLRRAALVIIGAGDGCDARFNGEPRNHAFGDALDDKYQHGVFKFLLTRARQTWGMS